MKKFYKLVSLAIAGALVTQTFIPMSAKAEGSEVVETEINSEVETPSSETASSTDETQIITNTAEDSITSATVVDDTKDSGDDIAVSDNSNLSETVDNPASEEKASEEVLNEQKEESDEEKESDEEEKSDEEETEKKETEESLEEKLAKEGLELLDPKDGEDFNEDGISDLMTKLLCDGVILTEDGKKVFRDHTYLEIQASNDFDGDGLLNGEEVIIKQHEDGTEYAVMLSDPCNPDSDGDGIPDGDDPTPMEYGLENGVVGSVRLVARFDKSTHNPMHGHVYLVYTSYVDNLDIEIDNLYGYYLANSEYKEMLDEACAGESPENVSWRSTVDEITEANNDDRLAAANDLYQPQDHEKHTHGKVTLNRGDYISIGNYGMADKKEVAEEYLEDAKQIFMGHEEELRQIYNDVVGKHVGLQYIIDNYSDVLLELQAEGVDLVNHVFTDKTEGGVFINRELWNQKYEYDQGPNEVIEQDATKEQLNVMLDYISKNSYFNIFNHNCSTVGSGAWNEIYGYKTNDAGEKVKTDYYVDSSVKTPVTTLNLPMIVKRSISKMSQLPGYIGKMVVVTGKKLDKFAEKVVKTFDVTKLFGKKANPEDNTGKDSKPKDKPKVNPASFVNTDDTDNTTTAPASTGATVTPAPKQEAALNTNEVQIVVDNDMAFANTDVAPKKTAKVMASSNATEDENATVVETVDTEEIKAESTEVKESQKVIQDEETPLAMESEESNNWIWIMIAIVVVLAGAGTAFVMTKKN